MKGLFDPDSPFAVVFGRLADLALLSLLWTVCSLPVVTLGAATAALSRTAMNMARENGDWNARTFFRCFRENFGSATSVWLILAAAAAVLAADLRILSGAESLSSRLMRAAVVLGLALWLVTALWAFPLTAHFVNSPARTLKNAFLLGVSWFPRTLAMGALWLLPVGLWFLAPAVLFRLAALWPVLLWGGISYLCAVLMRRPLAAYLGDE